MLLLHLVYQLLEHLDRLLVLIILRALFHVNVEALTLTEDTRLLKLLLQVLDVSILLLH